MKWNKINEIKFLTIYLYFGLSYIYVITEKITYFRLEVKLIWRKKIFLRPTTRMNFKNNLYSTYTDRSFCLL